MITITIAYISSTVYIGIHRYTIDPIGIRHFQYLAELGNPYLRFLVLRASTESIFSNDLQKYIRGI